MANLSSVLTLKGKQTSTHTHNNTLQKQPCLPTVFPCSDYSFFFLCIPFPLIFPLPLSLLPLPGSPSLSFAQVIFGHIQPFRFFCVFAVWKLFCLPLYNQLLSKPFGFGYLHRRVYSTQRFVCGSWEWRISLNKANIMQQNHDFSNKLRAYMKENWEKSVFFLDKSRHHGCFQGSVRNMIIIMSQTCVAFLFNFTEIIIMIGFLWLTRQITEQKK